MYRNGAGVPADFVLAYIWLNLARAVDSPGAAQSLDLVEKKMTPEQIAEGQRQRARLPVS